MSTQDDRTGEAATIIGLTVSSMSRDDAESLCDMLNEIDRDGKDSASTDAS